MININEDFLAQMDVQAPVSTTGAWAASAGVADFVFRIAATPDGAAIGSLSATATERSAKAGRYYAVFDKADLTTDLAAYVGRKVYVVLSRSGDLDGLYRPETVVQSIEVG